MEETVKDEHDAKPRKSHRLEFESYEEQRQILFPGTPCKAVKSEESASRQISLICRGTFDKNADAPDGRNFKEIRERVCVRFCIEMHGQPIASREIYFKLDRGTDAKKAAQPKSKAKSKNQKGSLAGARLAHASDHGTVPAANNLQLLPNPHNGLNLHPNASSMDTRLSPAEHPGHTVLVPPSIQHLQATKRTDSSPAERR